MYTCDSCGTPNPDATFEPQKCVGCGIGYRRGRPLAPINIDDYIPDCDCSALAAELAEVKAKAERLRLVAVAVADCDYEDVDDLGAIAYALVNAREAGDLAAPDADATP